MAFTVRKLERSELPAALQVEQSAMSSGWYLEDVADLFFGDTAGAMLGAFDGDVLIGIAKYTVLYDHTAWLEILRVAKEHQRRGAGRRLYQEFEALSAQKGIKSMAMYTGVKNIASASLAREFGLNTAGIYRELVLPLNQTIRAEPVQGFEPVNADRACTLLGALRERNKGFLIFNRTFMHMGEPLYRGLAAEGKVYWDEQSGSVLVLGNRFLEKRSLQIGIMSGDYEKCLKFALYQAQQKGVPQLTVMIPEDDIFQQQVLEQQGYQVSADLQVMEGPVKY